MADTLALIRESLEDLRNSEKKVAKCVLADPAAVITSSITELAERAGTSEPTVIRFCRKLGLAATWNCASTWLATCPAPNISLKISATATAWRASPARFSTPTARPSATP
jgi:hypothetical protein